MPDLRLLVVKGMNIDPATIRTPLPRCKSPPCLPSSSEKKSKWYQKRPREMNTQSSGSCVNMLPFYGPFPLNAYVLPAVPLSPLAGVPPIRVINWVWYGMCKIKSFLSSSSNVSCVNPYCMCIRRRACASTQDVSSRADRDRPQKKEARRSHGVNAAPRGSACHCSTAHGAP